MTEKLVSDTAPRLRISRRSLSLGLPLALSGALAGCQKSSQVSAARAKENLGLLTTAIKEDLGEVRRGLPRGAELLSDYFEAGKFEDAGQAREVLEKTRGKVQDLRVAKATFFALVDAQGIVLRTDQGPDLMAGKSLFASFPELKTGLGAGCVETRGEMPEASRVRGRSDGQWVTACPVRAGGALKGSYAAGWSWSAYAYRLENHLRGSLRSALKEQQREHEPLVYVYIVVGKQVFYAPVSPEVIARTLSEQNLSTRAQGKEPLVLELDITGREFGLAFVRVEELGKDVGIAVLRSET
ncbi:MAG TPA: hypothetical protein VG937_36125 [Polyangiaceae bacterium]|nr:hypothetical protein [Polyangiaceae bacterium]